MTYYYGGKGKRVQKKLSCFLTGLSKLPDGVKSPRPVVAAVEAAHIYPVCSADISSKLRQIESPQDILRTKPAASQDVAVSSGRNILFLYHPIARWFDTYKLSFISKELSTTLCLVVLDQDLLDKTIHLAPNEEFDMEQCPRQ